MAKANAAEIWSLNYRLSLNIISSVEPAIATLKLEIKEFFVLADIEICPYPAELATRLCIPKASVTVYLRSLEKHGFIRRDIDAKDMRRHRLQITAAGRKVAVRAQAILSKAYTERLNRLNASERNELQRLLVKLS